MQVSSTADGSVAPASSNVASPYSDSSVAQYAPANPEPLAPGLSMGFIRLPRFMPVRWPGTAITYERLHILAASLLAGYPWVFALGVVQTEAITWHGWLALVGAQGLCMVIRSPRSRLIPLMSLGLLLGLCFIQATLVYHSIVLSGIQRDYFLLGVWIDQAAHDFRTIPINTENVLQASHLQIYFDFISPAVNRVLQLTHDPFRLLAFHFIAIAGGSIVTWIIAVRNERLRPFQIILPVIFMMHPSVPLTINSDYHTSGIGVAFFIVGTYLFGIQRHRSAFVILLIGTLTKISFWPSWLMFGVLHAFRRRWLWALSYAIPGCAAIVLYCVIQPPGQKGTVDFFFPHLGASPAEVATNAIFKPHLWIGHALDPLRLSFFVLLLLPLGFAVFRRLDLLAPTLPLAGFSLADFTWQRTIVSNTYGSEYLGFCFAAVLVGLLVSSRRVQAFMLAAMTFGMMIWLANPYQWVGWDHLVPDSYRAWAAANPNGDDMRARERAYADEYVRLYWSPVRHKLSRSLAQTNEYSPGDGDDRMRGRGRTRHCHELQLGDVYPWILESGLGRQQGTTGV